MSLPRLSSVIGRRREPRHRAEEAPAAKRPGLFKRVFGEREHPLTWKQRVGLTLESISIFTSLTPHATDPLAVQLAPPPTAVVSQVLPGAAAPLDLSRPTLLPTLKRGDEGPAVQQLQKELVHAGFSPGSTPGIYGPRTKREVGLFQESVGLPVTGVADATTQAALDGGKKVLSELPLPSEVSDSLQAELSAGEPVAELLGAVSTLPEGAQVALLTDAGKGNIWRDRLVADAPQYRSLSPTRQVELAQVVSRAGSSLDVASVVAAIPRLVEADDHQRLPLDGLETLATEPLDAALVAAQAHVPVPKSAADVTPALVEEETFLRQELLANVLNATAAPGTINQNPFNTCGPTSLELSTARADTPIYDQLMAELVGPTGRAALPGGDWLTLQPDYLTQNSNDGRTLADALFQAAVEQYVDGTNPYDAKRDHATGALDLGLVEVPYTYVGSPVPGLTRAAAQLYGQPYVSSLPAPDRAAFLSSDAVAAERAPILLVLQLPDAEHAMGFKAVENGRLYLYNPWGRLNTDQVGGTARQLAMQVDDPKNDVVSIPLSEVSRRVLQVIAPAATVNLWTSQGKAG